MRIPAFTSLLLAASCGTSAPIDLETGPDASTEVSTAGLQPDGETGTAQVLDADGGVVEVPYVVVAGRRIWDGDIDLGPATLVRASAPSDLTKRWPRTIHWRNDTSGADPGALVNYKKALAIYQALTPLTFVEGGIGSAPFIAIKDNDDPAQKGIAESGCIGQPDSGACTLTFFPDTPAVHTFLHEVGHELGFIHEQSRTDRDTFVDVDTSAACVDQAHAGNYGKVKSPAEVFGDYDFNSIMEYPSTNFCTKDASDHCACLPLLKRGDWAIDHFDVTDNPGTITRAQVLSGRDIRAVNRMYEPSQLGSDEKNDRMGAAIALGDLNTDGVLDLAVGAPGEAPGTSAAGGAVFLYAGNLGGPTNWKMLSAADFGDTLVAGDNFGSAIAIADVDGDGNDDLLVGAPGRGNGAGAVYIYTHDAATGGLVARQKLTQASIGGKNEAGDGFGTAIAVGPFDNAGIQEVAIGAPGETPPSGVTSGYVYVTQWQGSSLVARTAFGEPGTPKKNDAFGATLAAAVLGGKTRLTAAATGASTVYVYAPDLTLGQTIVGPTGSKFGAAIAVGDFDNEGHRDLAIGGPDYQSGAGLVELFTGSSSGHLTYAGLRQETDLPLQTTNVAGDHFGASLAAGDLDGDGRVDLVVGIPGRTVSGVRSGEFATFASTSTALLQGVWMFASTAPVSSGDDFGAALAVGTVNPGGNPGIVVGAPGLQIGANDNAGAMFYWLGTGTTLPPARDIIERDQASALGKR